MNPKEDAKRISSTRRLTSIVFVYDDDPTADAIDIIVFKQDSPEPNNIQTHKISSYEELDDFSGKLIRGWL